MAAIKTTLFQQNKGLSVIKLIQFASNLYRKKITADQYRRWHSLATIGKDFTLAGGAAIVNESGDRTKVVIGEKTRITNGVIICKKDAQVTIGKYCVLQNGSNISCLNNVTIGNYVGIANNTTIADNNTHAIGVENWIRHRITVAPGGPGYSGIGNGWELSESAPIHIGDAVWIGSNCRILKGVSIGEGAIVAAGSVVTKNVEAYTVVAGNPAKKVKSLERPDKPIAELAEIISKEVKFQ